MPLDQLSPSLQSPLNSIGTTDDADDNPMRLPLQRIKNLINHLSVAHPSFNDKQSNVESRLIPRSLEAGLEKKERVKTRFYEIKNWIKTFRFNIKSEDLVAEIIKLKNKALIALRDTETYNKNRLLIPATFEPLFIATYNEWIEGNDWVQKNMAFQSQLDDFKKYCGEYLQHIETGQTHNVAQLEKSIANIVNTLLSPIRKPSQNNNSLTFLDVHAWKKKHKSNIADLKSQYIAFSQDKKYAGYEKYINELLVNASELIEEAKAQDALNGYNTIKSNPLLPKTWLKIASGLFPTNNESSQLLIDLQIICKQYLQEISSHTNGHTVTVIRIKKILERVSNITNKKIDFEKYDVNFKFDNDEFKAYQNKQIYIAYSQYLTSLRAKLKKAMQPCVWYLLYINGSAEEICRYLPEIYQHENAITKNLHEIKCFINKIYLIPDVDISDVFLAPSAELNLSNSQFKQWPTYLIFLKKLSEESIHYFQNLNDENISKLQQNILNKLNIISAHAYKISPVAAIGCAEHFLLLTYKEWVEDKRATYKGYQLLDEYLLYLFTRSKEICRLAAIPGHYMNGVESAMNHYEVAEQKENVPTSPPGIFTRYAFICGNHLQSPPLVIYEGYPSLDEPSEQKNPEDEPEALMEPAQPQAFDLHQIDEPVPQICESAPQICEPAQLLPSSRAQARDPVPLEQKKSEYESLIEQYKTATETYSQHLQSEQSKTFKNGPQQIEQATIKLNTINSGLRILNNDSLTYEGRKISFERFLFDNKEIISSRRDRAFWTFVKGLGLIGTVVFGAAATAAFTPAAIVGVVGTYYAYHSLFGRRATEGKKYFAEINTLSLRCGSKG